MNYSVKHIAEYINLRLASALLFCLPEPVAHLLGRIAAWVMFHLIRYRRDEAERRIISALDCSPERARAIAKGSMLNLCLMATESLRISAARARKLAQTAPGQEYLALYHTHKNNFGERGLIIAFPHMGNWEQTGLAGQAAGVPFFFLAKRQKNPLTDAFLNAKRSTTGAPAILNDSKVLKKIIQRLKNGEAMAILPDISEKSRKVLQMDFLGGIANVNAGAAMFARTTGSPIYPVCPIRAGRTHRLHIAEPVLPDEALEKTDDYQRMMQQIFDFYDQQIRQHPEQYFWYNKRWILEPPKNKRVRF